MDQGVTAMVVVLITNITELAGPGRKPHRQFTGMLALVKTVPEPIIIIEEITAHGIVTFEADTHLAAAQNDDFGIFDHIEKDLGIMARQVVAPEKNPGIKTKMAELVEIPFEGAP